MCNYNEGKIPNSIIEAGVETQVQADTQSSDEDFIIKSSGKGNNFPGGQECVYWVQESTCSDLMVQKHFYHKPDTC